MCWDRGRPARICHPTNQDHRSHSSQTHWPARGAGGTPAVPASHLTGSPNEKGRKPLDLLPYCLLPTAYCLLPTCLGSRFPTPDVFELFCRQRIDGQAQSSKFQAGDLGVDFLWQQVDAGL
jgi:hypothetical protein